MKNALVLVVLFLIGSGCVENKRSTETSQFTEGTPGNETIIIESIYDFLDRVDLFKDDKTFFMHFQYMDGLATPSLKDVKKNEVVTDSIYSGLIDELLKYSDDTCNVVFDNLPVRNYLIFEDVPGNQRYYESPHYFGSINFSKVAVNIERTNALYYLAINCGNSCSRGFVVLVMRKDNTWRIADVISVWHS